MNRHISDEEILEGLRNGNDKYIQRIYNEYFALIKRFVITHKGNEFDAEDVFQDLLVALFKKLKKDDIQLKAKLGTLVYAIGKNMWLNKLRLKNRDNDSLPEDNELVNDDKTILEMINETEKFKLFSHHFRELSADCQKVLTMFIKGDTIDEVTREMGFKDAQQTKNKRYKCKKYLFGKIISNPLYRELKNEKFRITDKVPRW
ncbi:MAG: RNA polymerase sigma factor [Bacteroidota bacterium]